MLKRGLLASSRTRAMPMKFVNSGPWGTLKGFAALVIGLGLLFLPKSTLEEFDAS
jgi:hypothetical protein